MKNILVSKLKPNPNNPRAITKEKFEKLKQSIQDFPKMLELRPIVVDENFIVLGGNMRLQALLDLGIKEVPYIQEKDLTATEKEQFIIKDNIGFGKWDYDILANEWDENILNNWGLDLWNPESDPDYSILDDEDIDEDLDDMTNGVRKAIMIDFDLGDYEKAFELIKHYREKKMYVGGMIIELLEEKKSNE